MQYLATSIPEVFIIEPTVHKDQRGYFMETYRENSYHEKLSVNFVQDNLSISSKGVLRGLHYQLTKPQAKLVYVIQGAVLDVAVDVRQGSPTFGQHVAVELTGDNHRQLFVPEGFAHGFCVLSDTVIFAYKCSNYYDKQDEQGIAWDDPDLAINWQALAPILSDKDQHNVTLADMPLAKLPNYKL
jgi:dTDP-4-dehydrorhamnose 3,5-epimerase